MEDRCSSKSCSDSNNSCSNQECGSSSCCKNCQCHAQQQQEDQSDSFAKFLLEIADEAWVEVLKDQIKAHILSTQKDRMAELAKIVSEGNSLRWKNKMEKRSGCAEFEEKICSFFRQSKK